MQLHRATLIVGVRRPRAIARLVITSIAAMLALQSVATQVVAQPPRAGTCATASAGLAKASSGLLMPSESDVPFTPFAWADAATPPLTSARMLELVGRSPDTPVEVVALPAFFRNVAFHQPWHDRQQAMTVRKFERLMRAIQRRLTDVRVYRVGTISIDAYIVGRCGNDLLGLQTTLVET